MIPFMYFHLISNDCSSLSPITWPSKVLKLAALFASSYPRLGDEITRISKNNVTDNLTFGGARPCRAGRLPLVPQPREPAARPPACPRRPAPRMWGAAPGVGLAGRWGRQRVRTALPGAVRPRRSRPAVWRRRGPRPSYYSGASGETRVAAPTAPTPSGPCPPVRAAPSPPPGPPERLPSARAPGREAAGEPADTTAHRDLHGRRPLRRRAPPWRQTSCLRVRGGPGSTRWAGRLGNVHADGEVPSSPPPAHGRRGILSICWLCCITINAEKDHKAVTLQPRLLHAGVVTQPLTSSRVTILRCWQLSPNCGDRHGHS